MRKFRLMLLINIFVIPIPAIADWAVIPELSSSTLWQLVIEKRAEVVSSVGFGIPLERHEKHTVFRIIEAKKSEGDIKWAINTDGSYRPVMCRESWRDTYTYLGSSCSIPGCIPDNKKCLDEITKNL